MPEAYDVPPRCTDNFQLQVARLLALAICLLLPLLCSAQISPGPLSRAHSSLEGTTNCTKCHQPGANATFKCLDCHSDIASRISEGRGYHAQVVGKSIGSQNCRGCHSEHNGSAFQLIKWQPSQQQFDHSKTGWALEGKHADLTCAKCHSIQRIPAAERLKIRMVDLNKSFLGLSNQCISCHVDQHKGKFGKNCADCHNASDWTKVSNFDHTKTRFTLTGSHEKVRCEKCHVPSGADQKPKWTGIRFNTCDSCHTDPHRGSFKATCQSCHNTVAWRSIGATKLSSKFDHSKTRFALVGKHEGLACSKCHIAGDFKKPIAFQQCSTCHRTDPHRGQFAQRADRGECSSCHSVEGWKPAKFGVPEHMKTGYPLQGKHASVQCAKCHIPAGKATVYKIKFGQCADCHRDAHQEQFKNAPHFNRCEDCHTVNGFHPSTFTLAKHKETRFQLAGAHIAVACGDCHKKGMLIEFIETPAFRFPDLTCTGCHQNPHNNQFAERMQKTGADGKALGCLACHTIDSWKDVRKFDHATTAFQLVGSHRAVACADCHKPPNMETRLLHVDFASAPKDCEGCHEDPHASQFMEAGKPMRCTSCHNTNKWRPSLFDHNTRASFKLEGLHVNVRCARCHTNIQSVNGNQVLFYKPTPHECAACHGADVLRGAAF